MIGVDAMTTKRAATMVTSGVLVALLFGSPVAANVFPKTRKVADHFDVSAQGFAGPIAGIDITVESLNRGANDLETVARSTTDASGVAHFQDLPPGKYVVRTKMALDNDSAEIVVRKTRRENLESEIALHWPTRRVLRARQLKGSLASFADVGEPSAALEGITLTLLEGYSGRKIETQLSASDGGFAFEALSPGLYFLRVEDTADSGTLRPWGRRDVKGEIPIELNLTDTAAPEMIELRIAPCFDCGGSMMYKAVQ